MHKREKLNPLRFSESDILAQSACLHCGRRELSWPEVFAISQILRPPYNVPEIANSELKDAIEFSKKRYADNTVNS